MGEFSMQCSGAGEAADEGTVAEGLPSQRQAGSRAGGAARAGAMQHGSNTSPRGSRSSLWAGYAAWNCQVAPLALNLSL